MKRHLTLIFMLAGTLLWLACGCTNPFAPEKHTPTEGIIDQPVPPADSPEQLMDNLTKAMRTRDEQLYESLLDLDFWFTETDCAGELVFQNGLEEELEFIAGSRDGSRDGIFDRYPNFDFTFTLHTNGRSVELGSGYPDAFEGDPDGHPEEDWEIFRGRVQMLLLDDKGDGFRVDQVMTYKLRQVTEEEVGANNSEETGLWKIIRWVDDPLSGDCSEQEVASKSVARSSSWTVVKQRVF